MFLTGNIWLAKVIQSSLSHQAIFSKEGTFQRDNLIIDPNLMISDPFKGTL